MKKNTIPTKPRRKRKAGRPRKYNPIGRPKKFIEPVRIHLVFEKSELDKLQKVIEDSSVYGVDLCRGDVIRYCINRMIGD